MELSYTIHSVEAGVSERAAVIDGEEAVVRTATTIVELISDGRPTLTIVVPTSKYEDLGAPGDVVTVSVAKGGA